MDEQESGGLSNRRRRAEVVIAVAAIVIVASSFAYLYSGPTPKTIPKTKPAEPSIPLRPLMPVGHDVVYEFVTPSLGWALDISFNSGSREYRVSRTVDGAKHWQQQFQGRIIGRAGQVVMTIMWIEPSVQFFDNTHGFIAVGASDTYFPLELIRTSDGGLTWSRVTLPDPQPNYVTFSDSRHGWLLANASGRPDQVGSPNQKLHLYATTDAGDSWQQLPDPPLETFGMSFRSPSEAWTWTRGRSDSHLYSSRDSGNTWQRRELPEPSGRQPGETAVVDNIRVLPQAGVVAYLHFASERGPYRGIDVFTSFDSGASWKFVPRGPNQVGPGWGAFEDASNWWRIDRGIVYKSSDSGQTWTPVPGDLTYEADFWRYQLIVLDSKHAWAPVGIGDRTGLDITSDGGLHWTRANVPRPN
jgi:photosystem II stability/assembly factor-like uncharacterized protein